MNLTDKEKNNEQIIDLLFRLGVAYLEKGDYDNSIDKFKKIINLGEASAKVYLNLSKAYIKKEQFDPEAQHIFEKSLQFEPENPVLNVILSQLYIDTGREDEQALRVYQNALKHNPQNADAISSKLIKASFQQGNIEVARELMQQFIDAPGKISNFLPLYIVNEWKHQGFDRVTQFLKQAIKAQEDILFYRWLVVNFLQADKQSLQPFELSLEDLNLCNKYLDNINSFDQLLDVYLYPAIERLLVKYWKKFKDSTSHQIEEYEILLSENAFSNMWEKALDLKDEPQNILIPQQGGIWKKLKSWHISGNEVDVESEINVTVKINEIHNQAETVLVMRLKGATTNDISKALSKSMSAISETKDTFVGGFKSSDGFLLFWKDVNCPIRMAVNFIQDYSVQNTANSDNGYEFQFVIHKLSRHGKNNEKSITIDLQTVLSTFQLEREMFFHDNQPDQWKTNFNYQLLITSTLKEKINGESQFSLVPVELSVQHPTTEKSLQIYQLIWADSRSRIERGEIQEIGRFKLLKELHQNQVFYSYKAVDSFLDRLVVVKILRSDFKLAGDQNSISELFLQQAKFLGKLSHPNIAMVYDIGKEDDFCFYAREYVEGVPLAVQRSINKKINVKRMLKICFNITQILNNIHRQDLFHGKLQPNNIFVLNSNDVKITDFQIASFAIPLKAYQTPSHRHLTYFAPEQIEKSIFNNLTDIFSLGVIMYEMLTDHNPFYDEDRDKAFDNILNKTPKPVTSHNSELPVELNNIVLKAIEKSPDKRYQSMNELEKELIEVIGKFGE
ncbi:MAG: protein kinase [bacterium]|nr:MAG: protein kinase [bacterium]